MGQYPYRSLNEYYRDLFGKKTARISLDGGFTCPNRDGSLGVGGCLFCSSDGAGDFAESASLSIAAQIQRGRAQTAKKWQNACYIAYFQAYTNTYAPVSLLRKKYCEALSQPDVVGIAIATRPDCLPPEVLSLLGELAEKNPLWVELGLQTANPQTAKIIRRGYDNACLMQAVNALHQLHIPVVAHVILGLPQETPADMLHTIDFLNQLPIHGIKLHLLHVLAHTDLAHMYHSGAYTPLTKQEYLDILCRCIARLRPDIVIYRLTGDGSRESLLAPLWSLHKRDVRNSLHRRLREDGIFQGQDYPPAQSETISPCP